MTLLCALLFPVLAQESADDLKKEIERLKKENQQLRQRVSEMDDASVETAQTITRLRQAIKLLEDQAKPETAKPPAALEEQKFPGPSAPLIGKVVHVNAERGYVTIGIGKPQNVVVGYRFEIFRETFEPGAGLPKKSKLGVAEVEKYIGQDSMSWLKVIDGNVRDMRPDDIAVAIRGMGPVAPPKDPKDAKEPKDPKDPKEPAPDPSKAGAFSITGQTGTSFLLDYGTVHGARQTDIVFAYLDGTLKARLRLDKVDKTYSVANLIPGSQTAGVPPPERGDQIYTRELQKGLTGKVSFLNTKEGSLAVDLRPRDGIKAGQRYEVRRNGAKVGTVLITDVQSWGSWAKPDGETKYEDIQKGDFVQVIEEK